MFRNINRFIKAVTTKPIKEGRLSLNPAVKFLPGISEDMIKAVKLQVCHTAAARADKMAVAGGVCVKMINTVTYL